MKIQKEKIKRKIVALLVVFFMFTMILGSIEIHHSSAATTSYSNLIQNFVTGTLHVQSPASVGFSDINVGVPANSTADIDQIGVRDYRGTGAGWAVTGVMNNMMTTTTGVRNFLVNGNIAWNPTLGTLTGLEGASTDGIAKGSAGFFDSVRTLLNSSTNNGMGNYILNGVQLNIVYFGWANQASGTYQNTLELTIS